MDEQNINPEANLDFFNRSPSAFLMGRIHLLRMYFTANRCTELLLNEHIYSNKQIVQ